MKKAVIFFSALIVNLTSSSVEAQDMEEFDIPVSKYSNAGVYFGIQCIPQLSWMVNKDDIDNPHYDTRSQFRTSVGLGTGYNFNENTGIAIDILYSMEGKRYILNTVQYNQRLNYIKIPVSYVYTTNPAAFMFVGKIGPQLGILTSAKIDPAIANGNDNGNSNKDWFEDLVIGAVTSAGGRYAVMRDLWMDVAVRFDFTFTNIEDVTYQHFPKGRANTNNLTLGIEFGLNYRP